MYQKVTKIKGWFEGKAEWNRENVRVGVVGLEELECSEDSEWEEQAGVVIDEGERDVNCCRAGEGRGTVYRSCPSEGRVDQSGGIAT